MPDNDAYTRKTLSQLLRKSEVLRQNSEELGRQAQELRVQIERASKQGGLPVERRKKPRLRGK